jgi:putative ABC transport system substrate-binding protein
MLTRRALLTAAIAGAGTTTLLALPRPAKAQPAGKTYRIGALSELPRYQPTVERWRHAFARHGYLEGQNAVFEFRWGDGSAHTLKMLAAELVGVNPDVIMTTSNAAAFAAKDATKTIPIIAMSANPLGDGLVASLAHPGGNVTGVFAPLADLAAKRVQLMKELVPDIGNLAIIFNANNAAGRLQAESGEAAARALGIATQLVRLSRKSDLEAAFDTIVARRTRAVVVIQDAVTFQSGPAIVELAAKYRLPISVPYREHAEAGALMSYGLDLQEMVDLATFAADKVLRGSNPAEIPMQRPVRTEFIINARTAKALGLTIPASLRLRADRVIE